MENTYVEVPENWEEIEPYVITDAFFMTHVPFADMLI